MFVDLLGDEVDLTVLDQDTPLLMRTTRLPGDASQPEFCRPVFLEIRRTIASVQNKLHGRQVRIDLALRRRSFAAASGRNGEQRIGPADGAVRSLYGVRTVGRSSRPIAGPPQPLCPGLGYVGRRRGRRPPCDRLSRPAAPPAVPKTRRREATIAAVCIAVLALIFVGWTWWRLDSLDDEIAELGQKGRDLDKQLKQNVQAEKEAAELDKLAGRRRSLARRAAPSFDARTESRRGDAHRPQGRRRKRGRRQNGLGRPRRRFKQGWHPA